MRLRYHAQLCGNVQGLLQQQSSVYVLTQLFLLKTSVFVLHFSNVFWHGIKSFPKDSSQNEIFPLLVIFHVPNSKHRGVKICFYSCRYQNQNFSLVLHSRRSCSTRVAFISHLCHIRLARIAFVLLLSATRIVNQTISAQYSSIS